MPPNAVSSSPVVAVPAANGDVLANVADTSGAISAALAAPGPGLCWHFGGAFASFAADPAAACVLSVFVRLADDSGDDFPLFRAAVTRGGPAPVYLPRARRAPAGRGLRAELAADPGGAAAYLVLDAWVGPS